MVQAVWDVSAFAGADGWQPLEVYGEQEQREQRDDECGRGDECGGEDGEGFIQPCIRTRGGEESERESEEGRPQNGGED